jgi:hypothetical protein
MMCSLVEHYVAVGDVKKSTNPEPVDLHAKAGRSSITPLSQIANRSSQIPSSF